MWRNLTFCIIMRERAGEMMKILLISDTHGEWNRTMQVISRHLDIDQYIHLGDVGFSLKRIHRFMVIRGNHDQNASLPLEKIMECEDHRMLCIHGNLFDEETMKEVLAKDDIQSSDLLEVCMQTLYGKLASYGAKRGCDIVFFGHTHHQVDTIVEGVRLINPGSLFIGTPCRGYAIVTIHHHFIETTFYSI